MHQNLPLESRVRYDLFPPYGTAGMRRADYYFEVHMIQFYRILFFFLELEARGIVTDEDDIFEGSIPFNQVPERIQAILYNDTVYRNYLLTRRREELRIDDSDNEIRRHLGSALRVREEDLIMLFLRRIRCRGTTTTSNFTLPVNAFTDRAITTISTTQKYDDKSGKRSALKKKFRKYSSGMKALINKCYPVSGTSSENNYEETIQFQKHRKLRKNITVDRCDRDDYIYNNSNTPLVPTAEAIVILKRLLLNVMGSS